MNVISLYTLRTGIFLHVELERQPRQLTPRSFLIGVWMQAAREAKKQEEAEEYRARMERANQRAAAPTYKREGKMPMTRSFLVKKVAKQQEDRAAVQASLQLQAYIDQVFP